MDYSFWTKFILSAFAIYRLSEIITIDTISEQFRAYLGKRAGKKYSFSWYVSELFHCPYCVGVWLAILFVCPFWPADITTAIIIWVALAGGQALLESVSNGRN